MADENSNTDCTGISQSEPLVTANDSETLVPEENSQDGTAEQRTNGGEIDGSSGKSVKESLPLDESSSAGPSAALDHAFGLPSQPNNAETSREGNNCAISEVINVTAGQQGLPIAEQSETGTPIHSHSDISVEIPCQGTDFTYYASVQHLATNEQCFSVHFVCTKLFQENRVSRRIKRMQEQQEIKLVPIGDEYLCQCENQYFHTAFIDTHMHLTIKFQLLKQVHRKFRILHSQIADKATLQHLLSLAQHRVPVAIAKVFIKCLAEPDEPPCQDHLRLIVQYGDTTNHMLIPIWG